jgi:hypothetical protein
MVDGVECEIIFDRQLISEAYLADGGEVQFRKPNGQVLSVVRDKTLTRSAYSDARVDVPSPDGCACRLMGSPHPGRHHPTCAYNSKAEPVHRATPDDYAVYNRGGVLDLSAAERANAGAAATATPSKTTPMLELSKLLPEPFRVPGVVIGAPDRIIRTAAPITPGIPHPTDCFCYQWGNYNPLKGDQHNPMCMHYDAWVAAHPISRGFMLVDAKTDEVLREATADEVRKSALDVARTVKVGERLCLVVQRGGADVPSDEDDSNEPDFTDFERMGDLRPAVVQAAPSDDPDSEVEESASDAEAREALGDLNVQPDRVRELEEKLAASEAAMGRMVAQMARMTAQMGGLKTGGQEAVAGGLVSLKDLDRAFPAEPTDTFSARR